jgi:ABC-type polysaccharide/polyol phosphate export permease
MISKPLKGVVHVLKFFADIGKSRQMMFSLSWYDFRNRYRGSYLGMFWAFVNPFVTIVIFWFLFSVAFKAQPAKNNLPFIVWFLAGVAPWNFFADALMYTASAITSNSFLVKKLSIRLSLLPIVKILSSLIFHFLFFCVAIVLMIANGLAPSIYWLQIIYYMTELFVLLLGLGLISSALAVFTRDVENVIGVTLQFGFWLTPIFWSLQVVPQRYQWLLELNPMFYIVRGYRDSLINKVWFWEYGTGNIYYWVLYVFIFLIGALIFRRLRSHFADVL